MKIRHMAMTAAVIGLGLSGAAFAEGDMKKGPDTGPGAGTPPASGGPATTGQANPSTGYPSATGSDTRTTPGNPSTTAASPNATGGAMAGVNAKQLLGADIKNANNDTIGEVESVYLGSDGQVRQVIVGVGGFLGMGERNVAVNWDSLTVADGGDTVRTMLTKDQLKAMPEYKYADRSYRGKLFSDSGVVAN